MSNNSLTDEAADDAPPILGSWRAIYIFVLVLHLALILAFYAFSRAYAL